MTRGFKRWKKRCSNEVRVGLWVFYKNFQNYGLHFTQRPLNYLAITQHTLNIPVIIAAWHVQIRRHGETAQWLCCALARRVHCKVAC